MALALRLALLAAVVVAATSTRCPSQWLLFGDMCYWTSNSTDRRSWTFAKGACQSMYPSSGSDMVSVHGIGLDAFLAEELTQGIDTWLGLRRANDSAPWEWTDGTPLDYVNWYGCDPDWTGEGCAIINWYDDGAWTGFDCTMSIDYYPFMCQVPASS